MSITGTDMFPPIANFCIGCLCTESCACILPDTGEPCRWMCFDGTLSRGVCSGCLEHVDRFLAGERSFGRPRDRPPQ